MVLNAVQVSCVVAHSFCEVVVGVISDIVIAKKTDAAKLVEDINSDEFEFEEMRGVQIGELGVLLGILGDRPIGDDLFKEFSLAAAEDEEDGPWAHNIPDDLVRYLSEIKDESIPAIIEKWIGREETWMIHEAPVEVLEGGLKRLRDVSQRALKEQKTLFLRICL